MKVAAKDYIVVPREGKTDNYDVWKATKVNGDQVFARLEKDPHLESVTATFDLNIVAANLGPKPPPGKAYGCDLKERYRGAKTLKSGIELFVFTSIPKERLASLDTSFSRVRKRLAKLKLDWLLDEDNHVYEVRHKRGRWAGCFMRSRKPEKMPHRTAYFLGVDVPSDDYLILHELGHFADSLLHDRPKLWARWQILYDRTILPAEVTKETCKRLRDSLASGEYQSVNEWVRSQEEEDVAQARGLVRWVAQNRKVRLLDLNMLLVAEQYDEILNLFPSGPIDTKHEIKPLVSEYACENRAELFAEAFAYKLTGREIPKAVNTLLEKTLSILRDLVR